MKVFVTRTTSAFIEVPEGATLDDMIKAYHKMDLADFTDATVVFTNEQGDELGEFDE